MIGLMGSPWRDGGRLSGWGMSQLRFELGYFTILAIVLVQLQFVNLHVCQMLGTVVILE